MSQENVEIVRRAFDAFNRTYAAGATDLSELLDFLDPDVEWVPIMAVLEGITYQGYEGMRQWIEDVKRDWADFEPRPEHFLDLGDDRVLVLGSWHARGRGGDVPLDIPQGAWLIQIRNGKIVRLQTFTERKKALEAAGLRE
jgi:ketosteroid isomerase-like protein